MLLSVFLQAQIKFRIIRIDFENFSNGTPSGHTSLGKKKYIKYLLDKFVANFDSEGNASHRLSWLKD